MNIEDKIPNINQYLKEGYEYVEPDELSNYGLCVPAIVFEYGSVLGKLKTMPFMGRYMVGNVRQVIKAYKNMHNAPENAKTQITPQDLNSLKSYINSLGVGKIGFTKVPNSMIFSNRKILHQYAIVMITEMKKDKIALAPSITTGREIFRTYYELGCAANKVKEYLNTLGYAAQAGPALGGEVHYPSLAQKAGLGAIGKHGLLITEEYGPSMRIGAVYTSIENLPVTDNNDHAWINDFCKSCGLCVKKCPVNAIYKTNKQRKNTSFDCIDYKKCAVPFSNSNGCTVCVKECAFFKSDYQKIKSSFARQYST